MENNMINLEEIEERNMHDFIEATQGVFSMQFVEKLRAMGFFIAPAAKEHHGNMIGGLYYHSKQVAMELANITCRMNLEWKRPQSPVIIGMLHDLCKVTDYDIVFDDSQRGYHIECNTRKLWTGHGEASLIIVQQLFMENAEMFLTTEEAACIRYHMGAFVDQKEWSYYTRAVKYYSNVLWTHVADMIASQVKGI